MPPARPLSPTMPDISGVAARFIEDQISWTCGIVRNADLYGKRSRHWSTADSISILVQIALAWLVLSVAGVYWRDETTFHNQEWSINDVISRDCSRSA